MVHQCSAERGTAQGRERERERERDSQRASLSSHYRGCAAEHTHQHAPFLSVSLSLSLSLSVSLPLSLSLSLSHFLTHTHLLSHTDTGTQECRGSAVRSSTGQRSLSRMSFVSLNQNWSFSVLFSAVTDNPVNKAPPATCSSTPPAHLTTTDEPPWLKLARSCEVPWRPPWSLLPVWLLCFSAIFFFFWQTDTGTQPRLVMGHYATEAPRRLRLTNPHSLNGGPDQSATTNSSNNNTVQSETGKSSAEGY